LIEVLHHRVFFDVVVVIVVDVKQALVIGDNAFLAGCDVLLKIGRASCRERV